MDALKCIESRRTIREYASKPVKESELLKVLKAATEAPSAGNLRNVRLIVVKDSAVKKEIAKAALNQNWMLDAAYLIVVCSLPDALEREYKERGKNRYDYYGVGAAIENMMLAANSLDLATGWVSAFSDTQLKLTLKIPDDVRVHAIIPLGKALRKPRYAPRRPEIADIVYFSEWSGEYGQPNIFPIGEKIKKVNIQKLKEIAERLVK